MSKDGGGEFKVSAEFENGHGTTNRVEIEGTKQDSAEERPKRVSVVEIG